MLYTPNPDIILDRRQYLEMMNIAFSMLKGMKISLAERILERIESIEQFFTLTEKELALRLGTKGIMLGDMHRIDALKRAEKEMEFIIRNGINALHFQSDSYPRRLRQCEDAPTLIYTLGASDLNAPHVISVVGTRHATPYGVSFTGKLIEDLKRLLGDVLIISGLAYGIDIAAHEGSIKCQLPTAAVFATSLDTVYPAEHRSHARRIVSEGGCLITEYPSHTPIHRGNFLARNRLVAGMADVTLVVESDLKGGAMTTARLANAYDREVCAVPGRTSDTYSRGCNSLIANNSAHLIADAEQLIGIAGWTPMPSTKDAPRLPLDIEPEHQEILSQIKRHPDATVNDLCMLLGMPYSRLSSLLFEMEMQDLIITIPGGRYAPAPL